MTIRTNRRTFLQGAGIAVAASALTFRPGRARAATTLTLGHGAAPGNPRTVAADAFAKMVAERTNGEVAINIAGSEQLGNDVSMLTSMRTGALDLTANSQGAASGLVPEIAALGLPFIFKDAAQANQVLQGPIGDDVRRGWRCEDLSQRSGAHRDLSPRSGAHGDLSRRCRR